MIKRLLILLCLLAVPAGAQTLLGVSSNVYTTPVVVSSGGGGSSFVGPGDIISGALVFYSAGRAYNASYAASKSPIADLVDTTTGLLTCTMKLGSNGFADLVTALCPTSSPISSVVSWCSLVGGCSVTKLYDQTGSNNHTIQTSLAMMPALTFSAQNGLPCSAGVSSVTTHLTTPTSFSIPVPYSATAVINRTGNFTANQAYLFFNTSNNQLRTNTISNSVQALNTTAVALTANDNAFHALLEVASSIAPLFAVDSSATISTSSTGTTTAAGTLSIMGRGNNTVGITSGFECEFGLWPTDLNSSYTVILSNMRSPTQGWNF